MPTDHSLPSDHQELAQVIGNAIAKRYHIERDWFKIHLVDTPSDTLWVLSGARVEVICSYSILHPDFMQILERGIKLVPRCHHSYSLITRSSVLELKDLRGKFSNHKGNLDNILKMALPKNRLKYTVRVTREIIGEDISTGIMHSITSNNGNDTEEELILRLRLEMGKLCGYGEQDND